jgi:membrane-associated phospholipid phosphatase
MRPSDYAVHIVLSVILIVGVYQFYFFCQRHPVRPSRELKMSIDGWIPYRPGWVWIYSFLYYPAILYTNLVIKSSQQFVYVAISFMILLAAQMVFFLLWPIATPIAWRELNQRRDWSEKFLAFVQKFDSRENSFPSMHTSVAMLTALHLRPSLGEWAFLFPLLITTSCLFTKQHYFVDLIPGALLGWGAFAAYAFLA